MRQVRIEGSALPAKIHLGYLQLAVNEAIGQSVTLMGKLDPETQEVLAIVVSLPDGVSLDTVKDALKAHAPERTDREEVEDKKQQEADRQDRLNGLLDLVDDLKRRVEALENGPGRK